MLLRRGTVPDEQNRLIRRINQHIGRPRSWERLNGEHMISKSFSKTGKKCRVTFKYVPTSKVESVALLGEFNDWEPTSTLLTLRKGGSYSTTVSVEAPGRYRFRYLVDGKIWANDDSADEEIPNRFGSTDSVLEV